MTDVTSKRRIELTIRQKEKIKEYLDENNAITQQKITEYFSSNSYARLTLTIIFFLIFVF